MFGPASAGSSRCSRRQILAGTVATCLTGLIAGCGGSTAGRKPGIWKVPASGGDPVFVANVPARPAWAPDGKRIVYSADTGVWIVGSNGIDSVRILGVRDPAPPVFSPDGTRVAAMDPERHLLHVIDRTGRNAVAWTIGETEHESGSAPSVQRNIPAWSPDGKVILVSAWSGNGDLIYRVDPDSGEHSEVSKIRTSAVPFTSGNPDSANRAVANAAWPAWSPDGSTIAFTAIPQVAKGQGGILTASADGGRQQLLAPIIPTFGPLWSPGGKSLLAVAPTDKGIRIVVIAADTGDMSAYPLPEGMTPIDAVWSPDGSRIAFSASGGIHLIETSTGSISQLVDTPLVDLSPAWSPDGQWVAFRSEEDHFDQPSLAPAP